MTDLEPETRARLEALADQIEAVARVEFSRDDPDRRRLFAMAWNIKQIARFGTPSEGI